MSRRFLAVLVTCGLMSILVPRAQADELQDISRLIASSQFNPALDRVNTYLQTHPKDAQARFLKGIALTETNHQSEAIQIFTALTEDYPELPEPYNNLAVIYASQGQYEKARNALELAIHTHPSYGTAHENLGDVYAKLATKSYDKALQLDKTNSSAQTKLALIKEVFESRATPAAKPGVREAAPPSNPSPVSPAGASAGAAAGSAAAAKPAPAPAAAAAPAPPATMAAVSGAMPAPAPSAAPPSKGNPAPKAGEARLAVAGGPADAVRAWASAWSHKDSRSYLNFYASDFHTPNGMARGDWERSRRERLAKPGPIKVELDGISVNTTGPDSAEVSFRQRYSSSNLHSSNQKTLLLQRKGDNWQIVEERIRG